MSDRAASLSLPPRISKALSEFADSTGRTPEELAADAIDRYLEHEKLIIAKINLAMDEARAGKTVPWDEAERGFREIIARAAARR